MTTQLLCMENDIALSTITFRLYKKYDSNQVYCDKYEVAFLGDKLIENEKGIYLSRIYKKNGKHRFYLTNEIKIGECQGCCQTDCMSRYCRGMILYSFEYKSTYVGKDINKALNKLFS